MQIRKATQNDFDAYINVSENTYYSMELKGSPKQNTMKTNCLCFLREEQEKEIFSCYVREGKMLLLEDNEQVIAFAAISPEDKVYVILDFFVVEEYKGKGIGTFFAKSIIKKARKERFKKIILYCEFKGAMEFWKKIGFKEIANPIKERDGNFVKIL